MLTTSILAALLGAVQSSAASRSGAKGPTQQALEISTTSGCVHGKIDPELPHVRQFLGIPYAQPPVKELRFSPPQPLNQPQASIDATSLPPSCMQYFNTAVPQIFTQDILEFNVQGLNDTPSAVSEDCLTLSIWTPTGCESSNGRSDGEDDLLPVFIYIYGGGFGAGGTDVPYMMPTQWVERTREHLVVIFNYRVDIFGFPNAPGLDQQNLGLLDQRLVVEWLKENVAAFGGDPERMVLWGQSAGGMSVDYYTFTYPEDPIVTGLIMDSGTAQTPFTTTDLAQTNFTFVAQEVGCEENDAAARLQCMREVDVEKIFAVVSEYQGVGHGGGGASVAFVPVEDEKVVFKNYTARGLAGKQAKLPAIIGTNTEDGVPFANWLPYSPSGNFSSELAQLNYLSLFLCPQTETTRVRQLTGLDTYVYLYGGNFSNISPKPWMGAYHNAELPMLFGTHPNYRGPSSRLEWRTSHAMQDAWLAFARDPESGLSGQAWTMYEELGERSVRKFGDGKPAKDVSIAELEALCDGNVPAM